MSPPSEKCWAKSRFSVLFYFENGQVWPPPPQNSHWKLEQLSQDPPQVCYRSVITSTDHNINSRDSSDLLNLLRSFNVFKSVSGPTRGNAFMENFFNYLNTWAYVASISDGQIADHKHVLLTLMGLARFLSVATNLKQALCLLSFRIFKNTGFDLFNATMAVQVFSQADLVCCLDIEMAFQNYF